MDQELYAYPPKVIDTAGGTMVWMLLRALYGLRQSPQLFYRHLRLVLEKLGFKCLLSDATFYYKTGKDGPIYLVIHVDDVMLGAGANDTEEFFVEINKVMTLKRGVAITADDPVRYLGKYYQRSAGGKSFLIWIPEAYLQLIIEEVGLTGCKPVSTPGVHDLRPSTSAEKALWEELLDPDDVYLYRREVGRLRYNCARAS